MKEKSISPRTITILIISIFLLSALLAACTPETPPPGDISGRVYLDENANAECEECDCDFYLDDIDILLYKDKCGGVAIQTTKTDEEGIFHFTGIEPGPYCVTPDVKLLCDGYQPTTDIMQKFVVESEQETEVPWFGFDHYLDIND